MYKMEVTLAANLTNDVSGRNESAPCNGSLTGMVLAGDVALSVGFAIVVVWTITSSLLVCAVNLRNREMLRNPYNIHIFHLALADLLSALMTAITPGFISTSILPTPYGITPSEIHCRLIRSHFFVFTFSGVSIYIILALAVERWYAVTRPLQYRATFHHRRIIMEALGIWSAAVLTNIILLFELEFHPQREPANRCEITANRFTSIPFRQFLAFSLFLLKFLTPLLVTCVLYVKIFRETGRSRVLSRGHEGYGTRIALSRMGAASTIALAVCWCPNQVYYALYNFGAWELNNNVHYWTIVAAMLNSCLNPMIFAFHSEQYREGFKQLLMCRPNRASIPEGAQINTPFHIMKASQMFCNAAGLKPPRSPIMLRKNLVGRAMYAMKT